LKGRVTPKKTALARCTWVPEDDPVYVAYHDQEWGVPVFDDGQLFEKLILDGFQAGLSWKIVLHKREGFRKAFDGFDFNKIARYRPQKLQRLIEDKGIIRNRLKIEATVGNARSFIALRKEFGTFSEYFWGFTGHKPVVNHFRKVSDIPPRTVLSDAISRDLKKRGFKFVGSTIIYAFMQAVGMVNDHLVTCFRHEEIKSGI
jgi:DNA-3-methyladenine glycosylase I